MASPPTDDEAERPSNQDTISKIGFHYMGFWRNSLQFLRVFRNQYPKNGPKLILSRATWANTEAVHDQDINRCGVSFALLGDRSLAAWFNWSAAGPASPLI